MKFKQRALALLLSAVMVLTFMPALAFADDAAAGDAPKATFDPNGGFVYVEDGDEYIDSPDPKEGYVYEYNHEYYASFESAHRRGFKLLGWSRQEDGVDGDIVLSEDVRDCKISEDTIFVAQWEQTAYSITWDAGEGAYYETDNGKQRTIVEYTEDYENREIGGYHVPVKEGDSQTGWYALIGYKDQDGKEFTLDELNEGIYINKDTTFYAQYADAYKVTLKPGEESKFKEEDSDSLLDEYVIYVAKGERCKTDPEFISANGSKGVLGWTNESGKNVDLWDYKVSKDTVLTAVWGKRARILLDPKEGAFPYEEGVMERWIKQGHWFGDYTTTYTSEGVKVSKPGSSYDTPVREGYAFDGWYTMDEGGTKQPFVQEEATAEFISSLPDNTLHLYAGYAEDSYKVTIDLKGEDGTRDGEFSADSDNDITSKDFLIPKGEAVDLNNLVYKHNDSGEDYRISGWYDADNKKIAMTSDGYFIPDGDITVHPVWAEPLPRIGFSMNTEFDNDSFFLDGDLRINTRADVFEGPADLSSLLYKCRIEVYDVTNGGREDLGKLTPVKILTGDDYYTWNHEADSLDGSILLYGSAIKPELDSLGIDKENLVLDIIGEIQAEDGEVAASDDVILNPSDPYADYFTPLFDGRKEALIGHYWGIEKYKHGYYYSSATEGDGTGFDYEILSLKVNGAEPEFDKDEQAWYFNTVKGDNVITITHNVFDPASGELTDEVAEDSYTLKGVSDIYSVETYDKAHENILPGETNTIKAGGEHQFMGKEDEESDYRFEYKWEITGGAEYAEITKVESAKDNSESTVTIKAKENIDPAAFEEEDPSVEVTVYLVVNGKKVTEGESCDFFVSNYYSELFPDKGGKTIDEYMASNSTVTLTPILKEHELVDGKPVVTTASDVKFGWMFDPEVFEIRNKGEKVIDCDDVSGDDREKALYEESFTIKRTSQKEGEYCLYAFRYSDDEGNWQDAAQHNGGVHQLCSFKNPKVYGLKNKTYNGNAQKQTDLEVVVDNPYDDAEDNEYWPEEGKDYKLMYKNNTKVGTATVEFVGIREFNGSKFTKTFTINPKGTTISTPTRGKKSFTVKWKKQATQTTGYEIQYGLKSNFSGAKKAVIKKTSTVKTTIKKLKSKKTYYVRIRTYKTIGKTKYYSAWSKSKKIKTR